MAPPVEANDFIVAVGKSTLLGLTLFSERTETPSR